MRGVDQVNTPVSRGMHIEEGELGPSLECSPFDDLLEKVETRAARVEVIGLGSDSAQAGRWSSTLARLVMRARIPLCAAAGQRRDRDIGTSRPQDCGAVGFATHGVAGIETDATRPDSGH